MNLWEKIKIWWTLLFGDSPIVKLDGGIDLVIENKEVLVRGETHNVVYMDESAFIESPKKKAKKVTKKKASKKKASKKKVSKKKKEK